MLISIITLIWNVPFGTPSSPLFMPREILYNLAKLQKQPAPAQASPSFCQPLKEKEWTVCRGRQAGSASCFWEAWNLQLALLPSLRWQCLWSLLTLGAALSSSVFKRKLNTQFLYLLLGYGQTRLNTTQTKNKDRDMWKTGQMVTICCSTEIMRLTHAFTSTCSYKYIYKKF